MSLTIGQFAEQHGSQWLATSDDPSVLDGLEHTSQVLVRSLRGARMRTLAQAYDEIAYALEFPDYFGHNADALIDCLSDLDWFGDRAGFLIRFLNADQLLADETDRLPWFLDVVNDAVRRWNAPEPGQEVHREDGGPEWEPRFRMLVCAADDLPAAWTELGTAVTVRG